MAKGNKATPIAAATPSVTETVASPDAILRAYRGQLVTFKNSELALLCSATATMLLLCHLQGTEKRQSPTVVAEKIEAMVVDVTGVKRSQTKLYSQLASKLYTSLTRTQAFGSVIASIASLTEANISEATSLILAWLKGYTGNKQFPNGLESMEAVRVAFGGKSRRKVTRDPAEKRVAKVIGEAIGGAEPEERGEVQQRYASAIIGTVADPVDLLLAMAAELEPASFDAFYHRLQSFDESRAAMAAAKAQATEARATH